MHKLWILFLILLSHPAWAGEDNYPRLSESYHDDAQCEQVLELAKAVYDSASVGIAKIPEHLTKDFVLKVDEEEGRNFGLREDPVVFQKNLVSFPKWVGNFYEVLRSEQLSSEQRNAVESAIRVLFKVNENTEISLDFLVEKISSKYDGSLQGAIYAFQEDLGDAMGDNYPPVLGGSFPKWVGKFYEILRSEQISSEQRNAVETAIRRVLLGANENIEISRDFLERNLALRYGYGQEAIDAFQEDLGHVVGDNYPPVLGKNLLGKSQILKPSDVYEYEGYIYWQKKAVHGWRYVLSEEPRGWFRSVYTLFVVKETIDQDFFIKIIDNDGESPDYKRIIPADDQFVSSYPPLMIREKGTTNIIAVDPSVWNPGENDRVVSWSVFSIGIGGNQKHCNIQFYPPNTSQTALLPMPVQKLATLLDSTVGDPEFEGTMQSYAHIRLNMLLVWQNVATRPWAVLAVNPYNLRDQVDGDLKKWSRQAKSFAKVYNQILSQYPKAEKALALYYKTQFHKTDEEANDMAKKILDLAFRSSYVFSLPRE